MKTLYACEFCRTVYEDEYKAMRCEFSHLECKTLLHDPATVEIFCRNYLNTNICHFCEHAYYAYGCDLDCQKKECRMSYPDKPSFTLKKDKFEEYIKNFKEEHYL